MHPIKVVNLTFLVAIVGVEDAINLNPLAVLANRSFFVHEDELACSDYCVDCTFSTFPSTFLVGRYEQISEECLRVRHIATIVNGENSVVSEDKSISLPSVAVFDSLRAMSLNPRMDKKAHVICIVHGGYLLVLIQKLSLVKSLVNLRLTFADLIHHAESIWIVVAHCLAGLS